MKKMYDLSSEYLLHRSIQRGISVDVNPVIIRQKTSSTPPKKEDKISTRLDSIGNRPAALSPTTVRIVQEKKESELVHQAAPCDPLFAFASSISSPKEMARAYAIAAISENIHALVP